MADKAKLLKVAQKHLSKGNLDKAIKTFQQLVQVDPRDQRLILRLADIQARAGRKKEAIENYEKVAAGYMKQDFTPKAIAVYKTILRLDPELLSAYEKLAVLYKSQGLEAEALSQFENLFQVFERKNDEDRQIEVLKLMADLDPENLGFQVRLGETLAKKGHKKEAAEAFAKAAATLSRRGYHDRASQLFEKITALDPDNTAVRRELCAHYLESGQFKEAKTEIEAILEFEPDDPRMVLLLGRILFQIGDKEEGEVKIDQSIKLFLSAGELESVMREFLFVAQSHLKNGELDEAEAFYRQIRNNVPEEVRAIKGLVSVAEARKDRVSQIEYLQLLGQTMQQSGDQEGAVKAYRKVSELDPLNEEAKDFLERSDTGDLHAELEEAPSEAVVEEVSDTDLEEFEEVELLETQDIDLEDIPEDDLDEELEVIEVEDPEKLDLEGDEAMAEFMAEDIGDEEIIEEEEVPDIVLEDFADDDLTMEITDDVEEKTEPAAVEEEASVTPEPAYEEMSLDELLAEADVYTRYGLGDKAAEVLEKARAIAPEDQRVLEKMASFDPGVLTDLGPPVIDDSTIEAEPVLEVKEPGTDQDQFGEDLEEADFYHSQGLDDEALRIYQSILKRDPQHPRALEAVASIEGKSAPPEPAEPGIQVEGLSEPLSSTPVEPPVQTEPEKIAPPGLQDEISTEPVVSALDEPSLEAAVETQLKPDAENVVRSKLIVEDSTPEDMGDFLDIAEELRSELADEMDLQSKLGDTEGPISFEDIFSQFKKGIEETLGDEEYETHYNLGIAYKDMGLFDDAIREFESSTRDPGLAQDSYSLMAMCFVEKKEYESAVKSIEQALNVSNENNRAGLFYQLGEVREKQKQWTEAVAAYEQVKSSDPAFEGIDEALERAKSSLSEIAIKQPEPEELSADGGMDDMLADLIREVEEMAKETTGETPDEPGKSKKDRISYL